MSKSEMDAVMALLDGIQGQLNAVKALLKPEEAESNCRHNDMTTIETMGGMQGGFCNECGAEFVVGVLDEDETHK